MTNDVQEKQKVAALQQIAQILQMILNEMRAMRAAQK
jgi:hypothetical protein